MCSRVDPLVVYLHFSVKIFLHEYVAKTLFLAKEKCPAPISLELLAQMITRPFGYRELFIVILELSST